jgi:peptidoglycan/xylan/chitin deacetylase (PgdA/CDA1 family)
VGNHTFNHLKGWETSTKEYIENVALCQEAISKNSKIVNLKSAIFRPPYGRIKRNQAKELRKLGYKIIMWDILTADFDADVNPVQCLQNVLQNVTSGSIIVFHDSKKAFRNLEYALPKTLEFLKENGFSFAILE